ncbi:hypothetical protein FH041_00005 [Pseudomonas sp. SWI7]|nr:hypothetical protein FH041_00005 [Pseudomonas sp. SWI7]
MQQYQWRLEQGAQADEDVRVASGQATRQVLGEHQQNGSGSKACLPQAIVTALAQPDQAGQRQHQPFAQAGAQDQGRARELGWAVILAARHHRVQACGLDGGEQCRPQQAIAEVPRRGAYGRMFM